MLSEHSAFDLPETILTVSRVSGRAKQASVFAMSRALTARIANLARLSWRSTAQRSVGVTAARQVHHHEESAADFDARHESFFNRSDVDGWQIRMAMNTLQGYDVIPEPRIIIAAMKACRRIDDYALAIRYLEAVKDKCGPHEAKIWPYIVQEIKPTLTELGISTLEEMGYDKPELAQQDVMDIHG